MSNLEIKVGDYVRTKKCGIARVDDIKHCIWLDKAIAADPCVPSYCFTIEEYKNIVKKHSSNIIDLIDKRRLYKRRKSTLCIS